MAQSNVANVVVKNKVLVQFNQLHKTFQLSIQLVHEICHNLLHCLPPNPKVLFYCNAIPDPNPDPDPKVLYILLLQCHP
jgi:hypothetical protein